MTYRTLNSSQSFTYMGYDLFPCPVRSLTYGVTSKPLHGQEICNLAMLIVDNARKLKKKNRK